MKLVSIIIVNLNGETYLRNCLKTLEKTTYKNFEVILVDNGSTDGSVSFVRENYPNTRVIENKENLGFCLANNIGIAHANGDLIVFLNNDTEVTPSWLSNLVATIESDPSIGICGCKTLSLKNRQDIQEVGVLCDKYGFAFCRGLGEIDGGQYDSPTDIFFVSGACMIIKREVLNEIGIFDPSYFSLEEDLDLCWRAHLRGYRVVVCPSAVIYHKVGGTLSGGQSAEQRRYIINVERRYRSERNTLQTLIKNYSIKTLIKILPPYLALNLSEMGFFIFLRKPKVAFAYLRSVFYIIRNFRYIWRRHVLVQSTRQVDDNTIIQKMVKTNLKILFFKKVKKLYFVRTRKVFS